MGLLQYAFETYEKHSHLTGRPVEQKEGERRREPLCPVGHILQKAQLTIELDTQGNFVSASAVDEPTIIPATEKSASRTSGAEPHPLCDQIDYVAPDNPAKHEKYLSGLRAWHESEHSHPLLGPVLRYVQSGSIASDLKRVMPETILTEDGSFGKGKISGMDYQKCLIRWVVGGVRCWEDQSLFAAYQRYSAATMEGEKGLCMLSGEIDTIAKTHDKGIIPAINGAKLISSNDIQGFTFRGRFTEASQACTIGYTASQKAHKALRWLAVNQGVNMAGRTFICWNPKGLRVVEPMRGLPGLNMRGDRPATPTEYRENLKNTLLGYRNELSATEKVVIAAFDAATTGRMALTYYSELTGSDFLDHVENWYSTCCWPNGRFGPQAPDILKIAHLAFGTQRQMRVEADERIVKPTVQRLYRCIADGERLPADIVRALVLNASQPQRYDTSSQWALLHAACALVRKYRNDEAKREEWTMSLDKQKKDRSYQFGRLLALMETVERRTYEDKDSKRETNAQKMRSRFCQRPLETAERLDRAVAPYFAKLDKGLYKFYKDEISAIMEQISLCGGDANAPLEDTYLMGYYLQRTNYKTAETEENEDVNA